MNAFVPVTTVPHARADPPAHTMVMFEGVFEEKEKRERKRRKGEEKERNRKKSSKPRRAVKPSLLLETRTTPRQVS